MDEQTTQATTSTWDDAADGAAYEGYEGYDDDTLPAPVEPEPNTETELSPKADELPPDGVRVQDGEVKFGNEFFGEMPGTPPKETANPKTPNWYTPDELKATPYEQWDRETSWRCKRLCADSARTAPAEAGTSPNAGGTECTSPGFSDRAETVHPEGTI